jgi:hypothetical protein
LPSNNAEHHFPHLCFSSKCWQSCSTFCKTADLGGIYHLLILVGQSHVKFLWINTSTYLESGRIIPISLAYLIYSWVNWLVNCYFHYTWLKSQVWPSKSHFGCPGVPVVAQTDPSCQVGWTISASSGDPLYPLKTQNRGTCRRFYSLSFHMWLMISNILALKPRESHVFVSFMFKLSRMNITVDVLPPYLGEKPGFPSKLSPLLTTCQVRHGLSPKRLVDLTSPHGRVVSRYPGAQRWEKSRNFVSFKNNYHQW